MITMLVVGLIVFLLLAFLIETLTLTPRVKQFSWIALIIIAILFVVRAAGLA